MLRRLCFLWVSIVAIGCHKASPLVGTWTTPVDLKGITGTDSTTYTEDGKFTSTANLTGSRGVSMTVHDRGTWKLEGNKLVQHFDDTDWQFAGPNADRANATFAKNKSKLLASLNKDTGDPIEWHGDNDFTVTVSTGEKHECLRVR